VAVAVVAVIEALVIVRLSKALKAVARFSERLAHLVSALELLTDTTEAGLSHVATELARTGAPRTARAGRGATARRIAGAFRRGRSIEDISISEGLSESEVRLHLQLTQAEGAGRGALRA
jgi:hypothetical protein